MTDGRPPPTPSPFFLSISAPDPGEKSYQWQIRTQGKPEPVQVSPIRHSTKEKAEAAGQLALRKWRRTHS